MQPSLFKSNLILRAPTGDEKGQFLRKGAVKVLDSKVKLAAPSKVVCLGSNDRLKPGRLKDVMGDGNVGVGQLEFKDTYEKAAKATDLWVTQVQEITAGQRSMWEKRQLLPDKQTIIAVPAVRLQKAQGCDCNRMCVYMRASGLEM